MTQPDANSLAPARTARIDNVPSAPTANNVPHKIVMVGTYDPLLTGVVPEELVRVFSAEDVGSKFGWGFMLHRMATGLVKGSGGLPMFVMPQEEAVAAAAAAGSVTIAGTATSAGTLLFRANDEVVSVGVFVGMTADEAGAAIELAMSVAEFKELPALGTNTIGAVAVVSKTKGTFGNDIKLTPPGADDPPVPEGFTMDIIAMTGGSGTPDIADALDAMGTGDAANEEHFTEGTHGYGLDTATLDAISTYNGIGDDDTALYNPRVARPMRWPVGDTTPGSAGLSALLALSANRKLDRTNMVVPAPGSNAHPAELAAEVAGIIALINNNDPAQNYLGAKLSASPGLRDDRWTSEYTNRNQAVSEGVGTTFVENKVLTISKIVTFYRPDNVAPKHNGYRDGRNVSITQNILDNSKKYFDQDYWRQITIVKDTAKVRGAAKENVRDIDSVTNALFGLADVYEGASWLFDAQYTKDLIEVALREAGNGFQNKFPVVYSGQGDIIDTQVNFDIALTVFIA